MENYGKYPFPLTPEQEERATRLHEQATIVDLLYWGPVGPDGYPEDMERALHSELDKYHNPLRTGITALRLPVQPAIDGKANEYFDWWKQSGVTAGTRSVELATAELAIRSFGDIQAQLDHLPNTVKVLHAEDIRRAKATGKQAMIINTQLIGGPGPNLLGNLAGYHDLGLRMLMLTYNTMTVIGSGCTERTDAGISRYGANVIAEMNRLGMIVDTAHCGHQTTLDACRLSTKPVVASHTVAKAVYAHARGKSDEELHALADTGGVIGVAVVPAFLGSGADSTINDMLDHLDHIVSAVGWEHVALGTDHPNALPVSGLGPVLSEAVSHAFRPEDNLDTTWRTAGFADYRDYPNITRGLVHRGYGDEQIKGILGGNALRVIADVCG
jgi:membrane dipeptidase